MKARDKKRPSEAHLVWERPEPTGRRAPEPLSRKRIVRAAMAIADKEGLASVSLRNVGAALGAGPMRLYGYLETKEELLELMVDAVYRELASDGLGASGATWRDALRAIAQRIRRAARKHPWFIDLLGGRPPLGPNALAELDASFGVLLDTPAFEDIDAAMLALGTVYAYVIGAIRIEASGVNQADWQAATGPYIQRLVATGRFPNIARIVRDATHPSADVVFDQGLDCVLDGIAARLAR
jgi:AcrR family transcriptional regulator